MHWADEIAKKLVDKNPNTEIFTCACGISPSGVVHMGNLREVITSFFVAKGLKDMGKKVRFIYSWDSYDHLKKVPAGIDLDPKYVGMPLSDIPDPFGTDPSYEEHFENQFIKSLEEMNIFPEYIRQSQKYKSGTYKDDIIFCIEHRKEIYDVLMDFKTQQRSDEERENYYPVEIFCQNCNHGPAKIVGSSGDFKKLDYVCPKCGHKATLDLEKDFCVKLLWKIDWPMRWRKEGVLFEPGGRDHSSQGGSYQVSSVLARKVFKFEPPLYQMYDFINLKGQTKKISSSSGTDMSPKTLLKVYEPQILLWMFTRFLPERSFDIALDSDVLKMYHEFDRMYEKAQQPDCDEMTKRIIELAMSATDKNSFTPVDASLIASFAPIVNFDLELLAKLFNKIGQNYTPEQIKPRFEKIKHWLENYCPEQITKLLPEKNSEFFSSMTDEEKLWIKTLAHEIKGKDLSLEEMQALLYEIPKQNGMQDKAKQKRFFEVVYSLLTGKEKGPRLYLFLTALNKQDILKLLDF